MRQLCQSGHPDFIDAAVGGDLQVGLAEQRFERRAKRTHRGFPGELDRDHHRHSERDRDDCQGGANQVAAQRTHDEGPQQPGRLLTMGPISATRPSRRRTRMLAMAAASALWVAIRTAGAKAVGAFAQQIQDLVAAGGVEIAGGLVGDEDFGRMHQGAGDGDALHLAAGELMREGAGLFGQAHPAQAVERRGRL